MADASNTPGKAGATWKKLATVGVLAAVLAAVLYVQFGRPSGDDAPPLATTGASPHRAGQPPKSASAKEELAPTASKEWLLEATDRPAWKKPELAQVVRYDPFALPAAFPQPPTPAVGRAGAVEGAIVAVDNEENEQQRTKTVAEIQSKLDELKQRGVRVIIDGRKQAAAIVGERTIHVGDDIDGFTVKAIDPDGVIVERKLD